MSGVEKVSTLTIAVRDQEEALQWFTERVGFDKRSDISAEGMRWVTIAPKGQREVEFVLASWFRLRRESYPIRTLAQPRVAARTTDAARLRSSLRWSHECVGKRLCLSCWHDRALR
jgi:hypothetical protein